ncbi:MAG: flavin reductase family protein [Pseudomonadota bacterium]
MDGGNISMTTRFVPGPDHTRALRTAFGSFATGVTVITTRTDEGPVGMTANSFSSVSLDPALALWSIDKKSDRFDVFTRAERYAIHVLAEDQTDLSNGFARHAGFCAEVDWYEGTDGVPVLPGVLSRFDCALDASHDAGDHVILIGRILEVEARDGAPLLFTGGQYGKAQALS